MSSVDEAAFPKHASDSDSDMFFNTLEFLKKMKMKDNQVSG